MTNEITKERVLELIMAYGADSLTWPEEEREAALKLTEAQPDQFSSALAEATRLDAVFAVETTPDPSDELYVRIMEDASKASSRRGGWFRAWNMPRGMRVPTGAILGSLAIGLASGYAYAASDASASYDEMDAAYESAWSVDASSSWSFVETADE